jgi:hypothetical protein
VARPKSSAIAPIASRRLPAANTVSSRSSARTRPAAMITTQTEMPINRRTALTRAQCNILSATASPISRRSFVVIAKDTWKPSDVRKVTMRISGRVLYSISQLATG